MKKVLIIYWSGTGNTEKMAELVKSGALSTGADVELKNVSAAKEEDVERYDYIAFGCPSMGSEALEEDEMDPFITAVEAKVSGKTLALFGSYDWGDGEWMRNWAERMQAAGARIVGDQGVICQGYPEGELEETLTALGKQLAG